MSVLACGGADPGRDRETTTPGVASVVVAPATASVAVGATTQLVAVVTDTQGKPWTQAVVWTTSDATVATVNEIGLVTGKGAGSAIITATAGSRSGVSVVAVSVPRPEISSVSPSAIDAGSPNTVITVTGTGFVQSSIIRWNGGDLATTFVEPTTLRATIPAADLAVPGSGEITVSTPAPGGGLSNALQLPIRTPRPVVSGLSPTSAMAGAAAFVLEVTGSGFASDSTVRWNGSARTTTYVSTTLLRAQITQSDLAVPTGASVTVFNPPPGGGASDPVTFEVLGNACGSVTPLTLGANVTSGSLTANDCRLSNGTILDYYSFTLPTPNAVQVEMTSTQIDASFIVTDASGAVVGGNEDASNSTTDARAKLLLPTGTYKIIATSRSGVDLGTYSVSARTTAADVTKCEDAWLARGLVVTGNLTAQDCNDNGYYADGYAMYLGARSSITVSLSSTAFDAYIIIIDSAGNLVAENDDGGGGTNARLVFTAPTEDTYYVFVTTASPGATGIYELTVD